MNHLDIVWTGQFKKDYKLAIKRHLDIELLDYPWSIPLFPVSDDLIRDLFQRSLQVKAHQIGVKDIVTQVG